MRKQAGPKAPSQQTAAPNSSMQLKKHQARFCCLPLVPLLIKPIARPRFPPKVNLLTLLFTLSEKFHARENIAMSPNLPEWTSEKDPRREKQTPTHRSGSSLLSAIQSTTHKDPLLSRQCRQQLVRHEPRTHTPARASLYYISCPHCLLTRTPRYHATSTADSKSNPHVLHRLQNTRSEPFI